MVDHELRERVAAKKTILGSLAQEHAFGQVSTERVPITNVASLQICLGESIAIRQQHAKDQEGCDCS